MFVWNLYWCEWMNWQGVNSLFSFSVKSSFEMMEVCWRQSAKSGRNMQLSQWAASRSTGQGHNVSNPDPPAWLNRKEHPLIQGIASDIYSHLSIYEDCSLPKDKPSSLSFYLERNQSKLQSHSPTSSHQFYSVRPNGEYCESSAR